MSKGLLATLGIGLILIGVLWVALTPSEGSRVARVLSEVVGNTLVVSGLLCLLLCI